MGIFKSRYKNSGIFEVGPKVWLGMKRVTEISVTRSVCFPRKRGVGRWQFYNPILKTYLASSPNS